MCCGTFPYRSNFLLTEVQNFVVFGDGDTYSENTITIGAIDLVTMIFKNFDIRPVKVPIPCDKDIFTIGGDKTCFWEIAMLANVADV